MMTSESHFYMFALLFRPYRYVFEGKSSDIQSNSVLKLIRFYTYEL